MKEARKTKKKDQITTSDLFVNSIPQTLKWGPLLYTLSKALKVVDVY